MRYRPIREMPPAGTVERVTFVAFLPGGGCAALPGPALITGAVLPGESIDLDTSVRIPLEQAGFHRQRVRAFALDGTHLYAWLDGDLRPPHPRPSAGGTVTPAQTPRDQLAGRGGDIVTMAPGPLADLFDGRGLPLQAQAVRDAAVAFGGLEESDHYADMLRLLEPAYLRAGTVEAGSGFGGTAEQWRASREMIVDGIDRDGTFLDLGCANGLLMESVHQWAAERGHHVEPYGLELSPRLTAAAQARLPHWADRIHAGNAMHHVPADGSRFSFVHVLVDLVPADRLADLMHHALRTEPGGRLLVSRYAPAGGTDRSDAADIVRRLGFAVAGVSYGRGTTEAGSTAWVDRPQ
jgi:hypothetical protein